jgi:hypothetical protein
MVVIAGRRSFFFLFFSLTSYYTNQMGLVHCFLVRTRSAGVFLWRDGDQIGATKTRKGSAIMNGHAVLLAARRLLE